MLFDIICKIKEISELQKFTEENHLRKKRPDFIRKQVSMCDSVQDKTTYSIPY